MRWWYKDVSQDKEGNGTIEGAEREVGLHGEKKLLKIIVWGQFLKHL